MEIIKANVFRHKQPELAKILGISITAVENNIRKLRQKQLLERVGPAKGGYWKINLDD